MQTRYSPGADICRKVSCPFVTMMDTVILGTTLEVQRRHRCVLAYRRFESSATDPKQVAGSICMHTIAVSHTQVLYGKSWC